MVVIASGNYFAYGAGDAMVVVKGDGRRGSDGYVLMKKN